MSVKTIVRLISVIFLCTIVEKMTQLILIVYIKSRISNDLLVGVRLCGIN
jgi:hypothetical protein